MKKSLAMPDGSILGKTGTYNEFPGGTKIYFEIHGTGDPLFLMHGGLETMESLHGMAEQLSRSFTVILPEQRGHGRTPDTSGPYSYEQSARDTVNIITSLNIAQTHLVGFSDGAITALFMGMLFPDKVQTITSIGGNYHYAGLNKNFAKLISSLTAETFAARNRGAVGIYRDVSPDGPDHFPVVFEKVKRLWLTQPRLTRRDIEQIRAPSLVMAGDRDLVSLEHTTNLFRSLSTGALSIVPNATHMLPVDKPEEVCRVFTQFLDDVRNRKGVTTP